ncbi:hypothetical protein [Microvirga tunisiensis]|uniref:Uncharacterized protein n=1 Tax=Microvirga tunisiensis TaxID=2108360 RepID=A0A5N7N156_9HYPH|nr:hypothetical protein [Microvirga tunisiensis]MPR13716.1 hypothetical protein [Microvirga tunisiensis]MPR31554.1 hypothetical protein [Microvirga tunisiensis]
MTNLVRFTKFFPGVDPGFSGSLSRFAQTVVIRLRLPPGTYVIHGRVSISNTDPDWQTASAMITASDGAEIIDEVFFAMLGTDHPGRPSCMIVSLQGVLHIPQDRGREIIDIRCATHKGWADSSRLIAIQVGSLIEASL